METIGVVRGEQADTPSCMLRDASDWGMQLVYVSRSEYRQRNDSDYIASLQSRFGPCLIIPEGGANTAGVEGCVRIAKLIENNRGRIDHVVVPVGTGTTLAGMALGLTREKELIGISVLKGAQYLDGDVEEAIRNSSGGNAGNWRIAHNYHCGGYAKVTAELKQFIIEFERVQGVLLDPVYTGKMLFAVHQMIGENTLSGQIVAVHTGGVQGRRGFSWLAG
jgi:1-aminocyclopropane-1-carboxylate deaminase